MSRLGLLLMSVVLTMGVSLLPAAADAGAGIRQAPFAVMVVSPDLTATVSWSPGLVDGLAGYRIEIRDVDTGQESASATAVAGATSLVLHGLPRWYPQSARVVARFEDGEERFSDWSEQFRVLSTLVLDDDTPMVQDGDGVCCETYVAERGFHLDAPMPVDVWLRATAIDYDGSGAHDGYDQTDPLWPAAADWDPIRIPAGQTRGTYQILWWGDDWKRFEYVHDTIGFEALNYPSYGPSFVHMDGARQEFTLHEDDPDFWPDVIVDPTTNVVAGHTARVKIRLNRTARHATVLSYMVRDGSARAGRDFTVAGHEVTVPKGQRAAYIRVPTWRTDSKVASRGFTVRVTRVRQQMAHLTSAAASTVRVYR